MNERETSTFNKQLIVLVNNKASETRERLHLLLRLELLRFLRRSQGPVLGPLASGVGSAVPAKTVAPREAASAGGAQVGLLPRVDAPVLPQRLAAGEAGAALVAPVFLGLAVNVPLVLPHVPQLREAFAADGAKMRLLPGVDASVNL